MTGGSLNLASAKGMAEDVINLNPQITFFKKVYKRHTNFGIENIQQDLNTTVDFGSSTDITITKTGSLISDMYMEFTLPPPADTGGKDDSGNAIDTPWGAGVSNGIVQNYESYATYVDAVGYSIINNVKLILNNDTVDKHTGLWYDVWNELSDPNQTEWALVGKTNSKTEPDGPNFNKSHYYVPLKFYFNRNPGLALPIFLLNEGDVKISITLNSKESLLRFKNQSGVTPVFRSESLSNFKFYTTYIFLEPSEELRISSNLPSEYLIETLDIQDNVSASDLSSMTFENPVKEIIWVFRHNDRVAEGSTTNIPKFNNIGDTNPNDIFNYSSAAENTSLDYGTYDTFNTVSMNISNQERFSSTEAPFFRTMQPYKHHSNTPGGISQNEKKKYIYVYSFALSPEDYQPSGSYNFSALDDKVSFTFAGHNLSNYQLSMFTTRYEYLSITRGRISKTNVPIQKAATVVTVTEDDSSSSSQQRPVSPQRARAKKQAVSDPSVVRRTRDYIYGPEPKKKWGGLAYGDPPPQ